MAQTTKRASATKPTAAKRAADKRAQRLADNTEDLLSENDLPVVVVKGKPRQRARLRLGEGGKEYVVTRPKDSYLAGVGSKLAELQQLAKLLSDGTGDVESLGTDGMQRAQQALDVLREFTTAVFAPADAEEVLMYLDAPDNDEQIYDLADAMQQLLAMWQATA